LFQSAAVVASSKPGPFEEFYAALVAKGMRPEMVGIPWKVNADSSGKPNGVPLKANSRRSEATLAG
jgi:hypothetical protein